jgi:glutamine synthetase
MLKEKEVKFVDLRFTDTRGKEQHVTVPAHTIEAGFFDDGKMFDGSSLPAGRASTSRTWCSCRCDHRRNGPVLRGNHAHHPLRRARAATMQGYDRDPRSIGKRAEAYLKSTGIGDQALFGPENEFFIFDNVRFGTTMSGSFFDIESTEAAWSSGKSYEEGNKAHRPGVKGGYFPVPPVDSFQDLRSACAWRWKSSA